MRFTAVRIVWNVLWLITAVYNKATNKFLSVKLSAFRLGQPYKKRFLQSNNIFEKSNAAMQNFKKKISHFTRSIGLTWRRKKLARDVLGTYSVWCDHFNVEANRFIASSCVFLWSQLFSTCREILVHAVHSRMTTSRENQKSCHKNRVNECFTFKNHTFSRKI